MKRAIVLMVSVVLFGAWMVGPAVGHTSDISTTVKIKASDVTPKKGTNVKFVSTVVSTKTKCYAARNIKLFRDGVQIARKKTNNTGQVTFKRTIQKDAFYWTRVVNKVINGKHGHLHTCLANSSKHLWINMH